MRSFPGIAIFLAAALLCGEGLVRQDSARQERGSPFLRNYLPSEYKAGDQNWAVLQDQRGIVYVCNSNGLLEFDGVRWRRIPFPSENTARSICMDARGRVYVGGQGIFGYLGVDSEFKTRFISLVDRVPEEYRHFNDVWDACVNENGVYFQTDPYVFHYKGGRISVIKAETCFHKMMSVGDRVFVRQLDRGLMEIVHGTLQPCLDMSALGKERVYALLPHPKSEASMLVGIRPDRLALLTGKELKNFPLDVEEYWKKSMGYSGMRAHDGSYLFATLQGGAIRFGRDGKCLGLVNRKLAELGSDFATYVSLDGQSGVWLALHRGVARVEMLSPFSFFNEKHGLLGNAAAMCRHQGRLYVGTNQGVYRFKQGSPTEGNRFEHIPGTSLQCWNLLSMDDTLLVANTQGVYQIDGDKARMIDAGKGMASVCLKRSMKNPERVFIGWQDGLSSVLRRGKDWIKEPRIKGIQETIREILEDASGRVWIATEQRGVLRLNAPHGNAGLDGGSLENLGVAQGLPSMMNNYLFSHEGHPLVLTSRGPYRFDESQRRFQPDPRFSSFAEEKKWVRRLYPGLGKHLYFVYMDEKAAAQVAGLAWPGASGKMEHTNVPFYRFSQTEISAIHTDEDGVVWLGNSDGVLRYDAKIPKNYSQRLPVLIRSVIKGAGQRIYGGGGPESVAAEEYQLGYHENKLSFEFALPSYDRVESNRYQYLLEGCDKEWSAWGAETYKEYMNLKEGPYRFRVRGMNAYGQISDDSAFSFVVLPPWYRTWWAWCLWWISGALVILGGVRLYTLRLRRQKKVLEGIVAKRTEELSHSLAATEEAREAAEAAKAMAEAAKEKAEKASAFKSVFIANTSHELRTPLNAILGFMRLLSGTQVREEDRKRYQGIVLNSGESLLQIVNDLLDLSKIEAGKLDVEFQPFDLREVVENVLSILGNRANEKQLPLAAFVDLDIPASLLGDGHRVQQMMINLLGNALKFTHQGHIALRVSGAIQEDDTWLIRAVVEDTGPGVSPDVLPRLFTAFSQGDSDAKRMGTGLGLSITRQLAELMGGNTGAESTLGKGSAFWFSFKAKAVSPSSDAYLGASLCLAGRRFALSIGIPILRAQVEHILKCHGATLVEAEPDAEWIAQDLPPFDAGSRKGLLLLDRPGSHTDCAWLLRPFGELALLRALGGLEASSRQSPEAGPRHYAGKVLLADDNPANRLLMQALFAQYGLTLVVVEDGQAAVECVMREPFDLVIMDGRMPRLDGPAALARMRELPHGRELPVLLFTASLNVQGPEAAMQAGFDGLLQKPIQMANFQTVVLDRLRAVSDPDHEHHTEVKPQSISINDVRGDEGLLDTARLSAMVEALGGMEGLLDLAQAVLQDLPQRMERLQVALAEQDRETLSRQAHDLKSNAANIGLVTVAELAQRLEHQADEASMEALAAWHEELKTLLPPALEALNRWMAIK